MLVIQEKTYATISDAAKRFGVRPKTIRDWIERHVIPVPPEIEYGLRVVRIFPPEYMEAAQIALQRYRKQKLTLRRSATNTRAKARGQP